MLRTITYNPFLLTFGFPCLSIRLQDTNRAKMSGQFLFGNIGWQVVDIDSIVDLGDTV